MRAPVALLVLGLVGGAEATPRMSLTAGTPCVACHVNPSGGEGRTDIGWGSMHRAGMVTWDQLGLQSFHDVDSNAYLDGLLSLGIDLRMQAARLGRPELEDTADGGTRTTVPDYTWFPMQAQPYLTLRPTEALTVYGTFLAGPGTLRDGEICDPVFAGMSCYGAQVQYDLGPRRPKLRAGVFQPGIGVRVDDHTILIRGDAANRRVPIIAPGYAEAGAEVIWQPRRWVRLEAGGFHTGNLDDALNSTADTADLWPAAWQARVTFQPTLELGGGPAEATDEFDEFDATPAPAPFVINTWMGASGFGSGDFLMINGFVGLGIHQGLSLLGEVAFSQRTIDYEVLNGALALSYAPWSAVAASLRAERAHTAAAFDEATTWQYVASLELFLVPGLEVRPEYRLVETDQYRFGQATVQVHLFY